MKWRGEFFEVWPMPGHPYIWHPERLKRCPRPACRRARRCVRPEQLARPTPPNWPSCPLVTDEEWDVWGTAVLRVLLRFQKELCAKREAAMAAEREAKRRRR